MKKVNEKYAHSERKSPNKSISSSQPEFEDLDQCL